MWTILVICNPKFIHFTCFVKRDLLLVFETNLKSQPRALALYSTNIAKGHSNILFLQNKPSETVENSQGAK